jgi:hypothetical protein
MFMLLGDRSASTARQSSETRGVLVQMEINLFGNRLQLELGLIHFGAKGLTSLRAGMRQVGIILVFAACPYAPKKNMVVYCL